MHVSIHETGTNQIVAIGDHARFGVSGLERCRITNREDLRTLDQHRASAVYAHAVLPRFLERIAVKGERLAGEEGLFLHERDCTLLVRSSNGPCC